MSRPSGTTSYQSREYWENKKRYNSHGAPNNQRIRQYTDGQEVWNYETFEYEWFPSDKPLENYLSQPKEERTNGMNYSLAVFLINRNVRAIKGVFEDRDVGAKQTEYTYKTLDPSIKVDDWVLVPVSTRRGFSAVKVVEIDVDVDFNTSYDYQWVVGVAPMDVYEKTLAQEAEAVKIIKSGELRKKRDEIAASVLYDQEEKLKALQITDMNGKKEGDKVE